MSRIILRLHIMNFAIYQASQIGGRKYNQDRVAYAYSNQSLLMVLADGMGGHMHGEIAAQLAIQVFTEAFVKVAQHPITEAKAFLSETMLRAHNAIIRYADEQQLGGSPGTTCVAALIQDGKVCWAHAGDSRLYLLRGREAVTRTLDHSMVQQWADWGLISAEEVKTHPDRNKITNCLGGVEDMFFVESSEVMPLQQGDTLLLCSDGLWGPLAGTEIAATLANHPLPDALDQMMAEAISREGTGSDNCTAIVARWGEAEELRTTQLPIAVPFQHS